MAILSATCIVVLMCFITQHHVISEITTLQDLKPVILTLLDSYYDLQTIIPKENITDAMTVTTKFDITSLKGVDVAAGQVEISGYLTLMWIDERSSPIADSISVMVPAASVWTPKLVLVNGISTSSDISSVSDVLLNLNTTEMIWKTLVYPTGACKADNFYYPFDQHECTFLYASLGHTADKLTLSAADTTVDSSGFTEHSEWNLEETSTTTYVKGSVSYFQITLKLKRKSAYAALKIIVPTILLAVLSVSSFLVQIRISDRALLSGMFVFTMLLLYFYTSALIPASSISIPLLLHFLFLELLFSAIVLVLAIITVRIKSRSDQDKVPNWLATFVSYVRCDYHTKTGNNHSTKTDVMTLTEMDGSTRIHENQVKGGQKITPVTPESAWDDDVFVETSTINEDNNNRKTDSEQNNAYTDKRVTWTEVGQTLDILLISLLLFMQICICCGIFIPLGMNL